MTDEVKELEETIANELAEGPIEEPAGTITIINPLTEKEAREMTEQAKGDMTKLASLFLDLKERGAWDALGYASWRDYVAEEFGFRQSHVYRLAEYAVIARNLSPIGEDYPAPATESVARPLALLSSPEAQQEAWIRAVNTAPNGRVTARHVDEIVREQLALAPSAAPEPEPAPHQTLQSEELMETRQPLRFHCAYLRCPTANRPGVLSLPAGTWVCEQCGGAHRNTSHGLRLAPGEEARLDAELRERMETANREEAALEATAAAVPVAPVEVVTAALPAAIIADDIIGGSVPMYTNWRCDHCSVMQPAGSVYTVVRIKQEQRRVCTLCLALYQVPEKPDEFVCPRCGGRNIKVNGHIVCMDKDCGAEWKTRTEFADEQEYVLLELENQRAEVKAQAAKIIDKLDPIGLAELSALLIGWRFQSKS